MSSGGPSRRSWRVAGGPTWGRLHLGKDFAGGEPPAADLDVLGGAVPAGGVYVG